ncbi:probable G-protein coupled receptor 33 [Eublepharis macularius]|uniref:Probable G-protein coupled receptor 33 n=1 Tax=Eublepharis macularius TaxID=481883 RepID=A0AA97KGA0_EUBMA|nr:probable G-protein coupled receptor 33 [Eublepharis macularius]
MEKANMTILLEKNVSTTILSTVHSPVDITPMNLAMGISNLVAFLVGTSVNGLFLWVLAMKMKRTVTTLWFLNLILIYFMSSSYIPFFAVYFLLDFHWVFGAIMCKVVNSLGSLGMFITVFLITIISIDRYLLICHPIWSQYNRTVPRARRLIAGVWLTSFALSAPYLAFRETREAEKGKITCVNNYALSSDWGSPRIEALRNLIHLTLFLVRFLLAFLIPFCIITGCYCRMRSELKKKRWVRNKKPFRILAIAVASFFVCWLPYHLYHGLSLFKRVPDGLLLPLQGIFIITRCFNFCVTPILYLFVGEKFQQICKMSLLGLLKKAFVDIPVQPGDDPLAMTRATQPVPATACR